MQIEIIAANFDLFSKQTIKPVTLCVRLILRKVGFDRFNGTRREIDITYEFNFEFQWNLLGCK